MLKLHTVVILETLPPRKQSHLYHRSLRKRKYLVTSQDVEVQVMGALVKKILGEARGQNRYRRGLVILRA